MDGKERYLVRWEGIRPTLIRLDPSYGMKALRLEKLETCEGLCWVCVPELDCIPDQKERFPEYMEITEEKAAEVIRRMEEENDRIEKELTRTCISHTRRKTEDGMAEVVTYRKVSKWRSFSLKEYVEMLAGELREKGMVLQRIDYSWYDEWGYRKDNRIQSERDLRELFRDSPDEIEARFSDKENSYVLRAPFLFHTIELEKLPKRKKAGKPGRRSGGLAGKQEDAATAVKNQKDMMEGKKFRTLA